MIHYQLAFAARLDIGHYFYFPNQYIGLECYASSLSLQESDWLHGPLRDRWQNEKKKVFLRHACTKHTQINCDILVSEIQIIIRISQNGIVDEK